jgi:hypothetical protein
VKTGRLVKFHRPGGEVHAYFYQDEGVAKAALYVRAAEGPEGRGAEVELQAPTGEALDVEVRAWVDAHFPRR